jgi:hypothetical protein
MSYLSSLSFSVYFGAEYRHCHSYDSRLLYVDSVPMSEKVRSVAVILLIRVCGFEHHVGSGTEGKGRETAVAHGRSWKQGSHPGGIYSDMQDSKV